MPAPLLGGYGREAILVHRELMPVCNFDIALKRARRISVKIVGMSVNRKRTVARIWTAGLAIPALMLAILSAFATPCDKPTVEQLFRRRCASCHGTKGEGTKQYNKQLTGSRSVNELSAFIAKFMPPGRAKKLPPTDSKRVAEFIYDAFYSPLAQERNRPARVELQHLTVRQYRNAVADLIGSFRPPAKLEDARGLKGEYFKTGQLRRTGPKVLERVDNLIRFEFGDKGPLPEQDDPYQFAMRWHGDRKSVV